MTCLLSGPRFDVGGGEYTGRNGTCKSDRILVDGFRRTKWDDYSC